MLTHRGAGRHPPSASASCPAPSARAPPAMRSHPALRGKPRPPRRDWPERAVPGAHWPASLPVPGTRPALAPAHSCEATWPPAPPPNPPRPAPPRPQPNAHRRWARGRDAACQALPGREGTSRAPARSASEWALFFPPQTLDHLGEWRGARVSASGASALYGTPGAALARAGNTRHFYTPPIVTPASAAPCRSPIWAPVGRGR